ncbi:MAG: HlyD family efflux transporter periplasmic adaptor subunit [Phycisphaerae bacterium]|nr:HlyD family efflux transporter periplasmic adaptor subunit [Phycisphaerae bacterium]
MDIPRKNAKRQRRIRRGLYTVAGLLVIGLITMGLSRLQPAAPSVDRRTLWIDTVKRGSMLRQVRGVGSLLSEDILLVPAGVSGRVTRILVEPGTIVEADTVILELSNPELDLELLNAESQLNSAQAKLAAQKVSLADQLLGMEANLAQMEAQHREAKLRAEVDQKQFDDDLISELNLTLSQARVENLEELLVINKKRLTMFRDQTIPAQLSELQAAIRQADSLYQLKQRQVDSLHVCTGKPGVLAQVKDKIEPGQQVAQGTILAKITNPSRLKAQLKVPEVQARDVRIGLKAEIDTYNGKIAGKVSRIDPTVMEGNVTVDISLNGDLPDGARPDLSVVGTVEIERLDDILYVGRPVFASSESTVELFQLVEEGRYAIRSLVQLGRSSVSTIEVIEGLAVGDEIILSDMSQWDEQERLRLK